MVYIHISYIRFCRVNHLQNVLVTDSLNIGNLNETFYLKLNNFLIFFNSVTCLQDAETAFHRAVRQNKKWIYYYMLGKVNEKRNWNRLESYLKYYLLAEKQQLVTNNGHRNDSDVEMLEINFRITISIFKYARKIPENVDAEMSKYLCKILNRPTSLVSFIIGKEKLKNSDEIVCYERNESWVVIGGVNQVKLYKC